ncbi:C40 family peptidase [Rhodococcus sp. X156]|uniref:C40 family peptidase n=1 Tax=Rhodococcus sp. X156 TaxID=2499145 RepID=UPI000FD74B77|nr:C40 family peptidase [Rhodococcus sp. X156]
MPSEIATKPRHSFRRLVLAAAAGASVLAMAPTAAAQAAPAPASASVVSPSVLAMDVALAQVGKPYVYGATGPGAFDCSGLVQFSYGQVGISLPRTTGEQAGVGFPVAYDQLAPGDLVFVYGGGHVGIYVGNGQYVYAPTSGDVVKVGAVPYGELTGARRI